MHPQGLIFDFDGTLADTMPLHWHAWEIIAQRHGFPLTRERLYSLGGVPSRDILRMLAFLDPLHPAQPQSLERRMIKLSGVIFSHATKESSCG